ncbi:MAG TPA: LLM class flavin-dependent oxidoreductase [Thermoanaerobaculia bacterium]|nr:LLM class flavin-dependent oxidoreductase [Thermoanaerobaculia bacterium]
MSPSLYLTGGEDPHLFLKVVRQAEEQGLSAVWIAEGAGLFLNPAVLASAAAVATRRIALRGCLALPLHNPIRVAEEWALVDNLSGGRAGIVIGETAGVETVRRLWRGEAVQVPDGEGRPVEVRILPRPIQPELPLWSRVDEDVIQTDLAGALELLKRG